MPLPMNPRRRTTLPFTAPFTLEHMAAQHVTAAALRGWRERREVVEAAPGLYLPRSLADDAAVRAVHTSRAVTNGRAVVSALGAATIHGLWTPPHPHPSLRHSPQDHEVPPEHLESKAGLLVPTIAWTALQLARYQKVPGGLIPIDSALRAGVSRQLLLEVLPRLECWPGARRLADIVEHGNALSGSALESWSRGLMLVEDLPLPTLQQQFVVQGYVYYADFAWKRQRLIGEADGKGKYADPDEIAQEKRRQARLQAEGYTVYRWGWPEVAGNCQPWLRGLRSALQQRAA